MNAGAAIIPVRGLAGGKNRLSPVLDESERSRLILAMAQRVVGTVRASGMVDRVIVVTRDRDLAVLLESDHPGLTALHQPDASPGLNEALALGVLYARNRGATWLTILQGDLPLIAIDDVGFLAETDAQVAIVPDRGGTGTNALQLRGERVLSSFRTRFGQASHAGHIAEARRLGLRQADVLIPGIAFDLDTPEDWHGLPVAARRDLGPFELTVSNQERA